MNKKEPLPSLPEYLQQVTALLAKSHAVLSAASQDAVGHEARLIQEWDAVRRARAELARKTAELGRFEVGPTLLIAPADNGAALVLDVSAVPSGSLLADLCSGTAPVTRRADGAVVVERGRAALEAVVDWLRATRDGGGAPFAASLALLDVMGVVRVHSEALYWGLPGLAAAVGAELARRRAAMADDGDASGRMTEEEAAALGPIERRRRVTQEEVAAVAARGGDCRFDFAGCDVSMLSFAGLAIAESTFAGANLRGTSFAGAEFTGPVTLDKAIVSKDTSFVGTLGVSANARFGDMDLTTPAFTPGVVNYIRQRLAR